MNGVVLYIVSWTLVATGNRVSKVKFFTAKKKLLGQRISAYTNPKTLPDVELYDAYIAGSGSPLRPIVIVADASTGTETVPDRIAVEFKDRVPTEKNE